MRKLNLIFALTSLGLLVSTGAMVFYDYVRGWKWFQLEFDRIQSERIEQQLGSRRTAPTRASVWPSWTRSSDRERWTIARHRTAVRRGPEGAGGSGREALRRRPGLSVRQGRTRRQALRARDGGGAEEPGPAGEAQGLRRSHGEGQPSQRPAAGSHPRPRRGQRPGRRVPGQDQRRRDASQGDHRRHRPPEQAAGERLPEVEADGAQPSHARFHQSRR